MRRIVSAVLLLALTSSYAQNPNAAYQPPAFADAARDQKLAAYFPLVEKIYREYAEKNHFPGYAFGINTVLYAMTH